MIQTQERVIGDKKYSVTQLGWVEGNKGWVRLLKIFAPSLGVLLKSLNKNGKGEGSLLDVNINFEDLSQAITNLANILQDDDLTYFIETFAKKTIVTMPDKSLKRLGNQFQLDEGAMELVFGGDYQSLMRWLMFAIEVNYANFFTGMGDLSWFAQAKKKVAESQSQSTSTGESTESQPAASIKQV